MQPGFSFPRPQTIPEVIAQGNGFEAEISIGCCAYVEKVRVMYVTPVSRGMHTIRLAPDESEDLSASVTFSKAKSLFSQTTGRSCRYGLVGELVSPLLQDSLKFDVMLPINYMNLIEDPSGYFFPKVMQARGDSRGSYELRLQGRTVLVTYVSRIRPITWVGNSTRMVQTLFISAPPRFSIGGRSYMLENADAGSNIIRIRDPIIVGENGTDFRAACVGNFECFRPKVHVICDAGRFVYTVNSISGNALTLVERLQASISAGDEVITVHSLRYSKRIRPWGCDTPYTTYVYSIQTLTLTGHGPPYNPSDRYLGTMKETGATKKILNVETAMYMSLHGGDTIEPLCPNKLTGEAPTPLKRFVEQVFIMSFIMLHCVKQCVLKIILSDADNNVMYDGSLF
jgi:hypothetical protein